MRRSWPLPWSIPAQIAWWHSIKYIKSTWLRLRPNYPTTRGHWQGFPITTESISLFIQSTLHVRVWTATTIPGSTNKSVSVLYYPIGLNLSTASAILPIFFLGFQFHHLYRRISNVCRARVDVFTFFRDNYPPLLGGGLLPAQQVLKRARNPFNSIVGQIKSHPPISGIFRQSSKNLYLSLTKFPYNG